jgi:hypothetical protein
MTRTVHFVMDSAPPWVKMHHQLDEAAGQNGQFMPQVRESAKQWQAGTNLAGMHQ